jgi:hypothetical protein
MEESRLEFRTFSWAEQIQANKPGGDAVSENIDAYVERKMRPRGIQANGVSIYRARRLRGMTQEALAAAAACDEKTVRRAEKCCRLDIATLLRIAEALKLPYRRVVR